MVTKIAIEVTHTEFIKAPRERVYDAFATADGLDGWFTRGSRVDARPGGEIYFRWADWGPEKNINMDATGRVIEAKRPERFVYEWPGDEKGTFTTVEIILEEREGGTLLRLREYGFLDTDGGRKHMVGNASGWGEALTLVKIWLEHGIHYN